MRRPSPIVRHHLLEIILWPNGDGTFRRIVNSMKRLKELNIYDDFKMTIPISRGEHASIHSPEKFGKKRSMESRNRMSVSAKRSYLNGGHRGGMKFKGRTWKLVNGRRVWDAT